MFFFDSDIFFLGIFLKCEFNIDVLLLLLLFILWSVDFLVMLFMKNDFILLFILFKGIYYFFIFVEKVEIFLFLEIMLMGILMMMLLIEEEFVD